MGLRDTFRFRADPEQLTVEYGYKPIEAAPFSKIRPMTAAGQKLKLDDQETMDKFRYRVYTEWQNDAWGYFDAIGEVKFAFSMLAAVVSRVRLFAGLNLDDDSPPISTQSYRRKQADLTKLEIDKETKRELTAPKALTPKIMDRAEAMLRELGTGLSGMPGFLRNYTLNMSVAGECYLVKIDDQWFIKSSNELVVDAGGQLLLRRSRTAGGIPTSGSANSTGLGDRLLPPDTPICRFWREHPRYTEEPDSSMLGLREACDELLTLQRMIRVVARSNMNAGILKVSDDVTVAGDSIEADIKTDEQENDALLQSLYDNLTAGVIDETNAATLVPNVLVGPADALKATEWMNLDRKIDQFLVERCDRALDRVLQGIDLPKDYVTGLANVRYTNSKAIDESLYKSHVEPLILMLCDGLTNAYLIPGLTEEFGELSQEVLDVLRVWYDPSDIVAKSDPADAADSGFDKYLVSADAWRAAHGFADTDAPGELEMALRLLQKQTLAPELVTTLFNTLLKNITAAERTSNISKMPVPFPESAQQMLYGETVAPNPKESFGDNKDITPAEDDQEEEEPEEQEEPIAASAFGADRLYAIPYNGNTIQDQYRIIAENAVRTGQSRLQKYSTAHLTPTQPLDRTLQREGGSGAKDLPPIVICKDGVKYLLDGHHRGMRKSKIEAAEVDVEKLRTDLSKGA